MDEVLFASAVAQAGLLRNRQISSRELVAAYLDRIDRYDKSLAAYVTVDDDGARRAATAADIRLAGSWPTDDLPPFLGVPLAVKDLLDTAGLRTTYSSSAFADHVPAADAAAVARARAAGFVVLGKTNTSEFGSLSVTESELNGASRNPWDLDLTPGGSSGGSAAAVAGGLAPVALGTDGGGSVRIPASCCGLVGLKPSRGRISLGPRGGHDLDGYTVVGPIARHVEDVAALLDVLAGYEVGDPYWAPPPPRPYSEELHTHPGRLRIGVATSAPGGIPVAVECQHVALDAARFLADLGHEVEEATPDWEMDDLFATMLRVWVTDFAYYGDAPDPGRFGSVVARLYEQAVGQSSVDYVLAAQEMRRLARRICGFWSEYDLLLTPTLGLAPVPVGWYFDTSDDPWVQFHRDALFVPFFTPLANVTGLPAVSVPLGWPDGGAPIGVQLTGGPAREDVLIRVAAQLEAARPWAHRRPEWPAS